MSDFEIDLGNGKSIVVDAPDAQAAAAAARLHLAKAAGTADAGRSRDQGISQAFGSGALANFGDEATAAVRAAAPGFANWMMDPGLKRDSSIGGSPEPQTVSNAPTFGQRYDEELARERAKAEVFRQVNPATAMGANIAGNLATTALALPAGATAVGPSALANVAKNIGVGAGIGGLTGFGEGEGIDDRLKKAGLGAAVGGGAGALVRPLAAVGRSIAESTPVRQVVTDPLSRLGSMLKGEAAAEAPTAEQGAAQRIASTFQRDRLTPELAQQRLTQLGPEAIPSDISQSLLQQGVNMKTLGGETRQRAQDFFDPFLPAAGQEGRNARTGTRMIAAAEGNAPPPSHFGAQEGMAGHLQGVGQRAYGLMDEAGFKNSPGISRMMTESPEIEGAVDRVLASEKAARAGTDRPPASPVEIMHMVKRDIQNIGLDANGRPSSTAFQWQQTANDFVRQLKAANPALASADREYAQAASLPEHYAAGSSIFSKGMGEKATAGSAPAIEDLLQGANTAQTAAARAGAINAVRARAGTTSGALGLAQDIKTGITPGGVQESLRAVMPNEAENLINRSSAERIYANTANRYLGGPHTADDLTGVGGNLAVRATPGGIVPRFTETAKAAASWVAAPNEAVRNEIGRMLLSADPKEQKRTLELIAQILQQRAAGTPVAAGLAGGAGAQAGKAF